MTNSSRLKNNSCPPWTSIPTVVENWKPSHPNPEYAIHWKILVQLNKGGFLITCTQQKIAHTFQKELYFPRYNTKWSGENEILRGIFRLVSRFPLNFVLYLGNFDYFLDSAIGRYFLVENYSRIYIFFQNRSLDHFCRIWW